MSENIQDKGRRLLTEGRLAVLNVGGDDSMIHATCRGDSADIYHLGFDPKRKQWRCTCPAKGKCSHLVALQLVTIQPTTEEG